MVFIPFWIVWIKCKVQNETLNLRYRHDVKLCQVLLKHWGKKASDKLGLLDLRLLICICVWVFAMKIMIKRCLISGKLPILTWIMQQTSKLRRKIVIWLYNVLIITWSAYYWCLITIQFGQLCTLLHMCLNINFVVHCVWLCHSLPYM